MGQRRSLWAGHRICTGSSTGLASVGQAWAGHPVQRGAEAGSSFGSSMDLALARAWHWVSGALPEMTGPQPGPSGWVRGNAVLGSRTPRRSVGVELGMGCGVMLPRSPPRPGVRATGKGKHFPAGVQVPRRVRNAPGLLEGCSHCCERLSRSRTVF